MKKIIPNVITSANLFCGCLAITQIAEGNFIFASILVLLGAFFDFFDGLVARALKVGSPMGAELDSLADVVTFGIVPAYLAFEWLNQFDFSIFNYGAFLIAIFSAIRLAKFNVDDRQTTPFIGLPTPANALFWIAIPLIYWQVENDIHFIDVSFLLPIYESASFIFIAIILFSYLLIAELPLLALKFKTLQWKDNKFRFSLILLSVILIVVFLFAAIPFIILLYLILSIVQNNYKHNNEV
ncbi:MAG: CDP-diacylglycerol--serine O-phosphatidyltransferase [Flavobacteriales bacterium]|nr:CDP-diacylglycerol--serine O-phosphatidyltransferase [Flavobacteriales bacterium]